MAEKRRGKKTRKCQLCSLDDTILEDMEFELVGKNDMKKFYHKECFVKHKKKQEYINQELKELDDLRISIQDIYGIEELPHQAYPLLQNLRMGNPVFGNKQRVGKRYREGYSYTLLQETYEYCKDDILYWNGKKDFDGFMSAFKYGLAIVIDKAYYIEQRVSQRKSQEIKITNHLESVNQEDYSFETNYKKPSKNNTDITDFLDE